MAKQIVDEKIKLSVIIDGNTAQKELYDLEKATRALNQSQAALRLEKTRLEKAGQTESARYKEITLTLKANSAAITANKARMGELQKEIGITGLTMKQLQDKARSLRIALNNAVPGSEAFKAYQLELNQVSARMDELRGKSAATNSSISSMGQGFSRAQAMATTFILGLTGIVVSLQKVIDYNGELSDAQADVMKTTRMNKQEVDELTKSFGLFQSRTSRIDLLKIAEEGGRIGIAKEEIADFTKEMDKAVIAMGDSFTGGVSEVASKLGKLKTLFSETNDMSVVEGYNRIGSAINELGADGVASEANIAEFATRIGSLPEEMKPSIATTLALGAAFEESGLEAEVSSRAYGIFLKQASTESAKFAKVMGLTQVEVERLINQDPMEFFLKFSQGMKGLSATDSSKILDNLGLNADGVNKIVGAAANNTQRFRDLMKLSNDEFERGTSLTAEAETKNKSFAATLERIKNTVTGWFSADGLVAFLESSVNWFAKFIGASEDADGSVGKWRTGLVITAKVIAVVTAAILTNVAWQKLVFLWTTRNTQANVLYRAATLARAVADGIATVASQAFAAATMLLRGNVVGATQAFRVMTATMKTTPWGAILALVAAATAAYVLFSDKTEKMTRSQQAMAEVLLETEKATASQVGQLEQWFKIAQDANAPLEARKKAIADINALSPEYLGNISLENVNTIATTTAKKEYIDMLRKEAEMKAILSQIDKLNNEKLETERQTLEENVSWAEDAWNRTKSLLSGGGLADVAARNAITGWQNQKDKITGVDEAIKDLWKSYDALYKKTSGKPKPSPEEEGGGGGNVVVDPAAEAAKKAAEAAAKAAAKKAAEERKKRLEEQKKFHDDLLALERQTIDMRLALMAEGMEKDLAIEAETHRRKIEDLKRQRIAEDQIRAIDKDIRQADAAGDNSKYDYLVAQKQFWVNKNAELDRQIELSEQTHWQKVGTIQEKETARQITKSKETYDRQKTVRQTAFNEELLQVTSLSQAKEMLRGKLSNDELSQLRTLEDAKKALQDQFNKEELEREIAFLNESIAKMEEMVASKEFMGVDLNLLTPEQREKIQKQIEEARKLASELKLSLTGKASTEPTTEDRAESAKKEINGMEGGDILGLSVSAIAHMRDQVKALGDDTASMWEAFALGANVLQALGGMLSSYNSMLTANENAQLKKYEQNSEAKKRSLKRQLDQGLINQAQYRKALENQDKELERKKAEVEYKQAKRQKQMAIVDVIIKTAMGIMQAYAQLGPIGGTIAAVLIGALGAFQVSQINKQPLPAKGFEEGLYGEHLVKREQDGKLFKARYGGDTKSGIVRRPTLFLAGENNRPEMIIDNNAYRRMDPALKDSLERELRRVKGFEQGYYKEHPNGDSVYSVPSSGSGNASQSVSADVVRALERSTSATTAMHDLMERIYREGIHAHVARSGRNIEELRRALKDAEQRRNNSKV